MTDVVDIFSKKKISEGECTKRGEGYDKNIPFDWQGYYENVKSIQYGFDYLSAHDKRVAFDSVADAFCEVLLRVFSDKKGE